MITNHYMKVLSNLRLQPVEFHELFEYGYTHQSFFEDRDIAKYYFEYSKAINRSCIVFDLDTPVLYIAATRIDGIHSFHGWPIQPQLAKGIDDEQVLIRALELVLNSWSEEFSEGRYLFNYSRAIAYCGLKRWCSVNPRLIARMPLEKSELEIHADLRTSYKSLINKGRRELKTIVYYGEDVSWEVTEQAMNFHIATSGRRTRSEATWRVQHDLILLKKGFLISSFHEDKLVASSYVYTDGREAIYGSGVYDRELMSSNMPLAHWNLYKAIMFAKEIGTQSFILGDIGPNFLAPKYENIAMFKRGFSAEIELNTELLIHPKNIEPELKFWHPTS